METKICSGCNGILTVDKFTHLSRNKDGLNTRCRECCDIYRVKYESNNGKKNKIRQQNYYKNNKETIAKYHKQYYEENRVSILEKIENIRLLVQFTQRSV